MGTAIKHHVPDWTEQSDAQHWMAECRDVENYKWQLNLLLHRMLIQL